MNKEKSKRKSKRKKSKSRRKSPKKQSKRRRKSNSMRKKSNTQIKQYVKHDFKEIGTSGGPINIYVYGRSYCPYCLKAKILLNKLKRKIKKKLFNGRTVPCVVGGYSDLKRMADNTDTHEDDVRYLLAGNYKYIPIVRMNGRFLGGYCELEQVATELDKATA